MNQWGLKGIGHLIFFIFLFQIYVPLMLVNAADDPLVHESLLTIPKSLSGKCFFLLLPQPLSKLPQLSSVTFTTLSPPVSALRKVKLYCNGLW